jgi:hypothetical protein
VKGGVYSENTAPIPMVIVIAHLVLDVQHQDEAAGYADGKAGDVDKGKNLVAGQVSQCHFNEVPDHVIFIGQRHMPINVPAERG